MAFNYALTLNLENRCVLIVGGGNVALRKAKGFKDTGAHVTVIAPNIHPELLDMVDVSCQKREFRATDIAEYAPALVIAATDDLALNHRVVMHAKASGIWVNSITHPYDGDFAVPAVIKKADYALAISTYGQGPGFAKALRKYLETLLGEELDEAVRLYIEVRQWVLETVDDGDKRANMLKKCDLNAIFQLVNDESIAKDERLEKMKEWLSCS